MPGGVLQGPLIALGHGERDYRPLVVSNCRLGRGNGLAVVPIIGQRHDQQQSADGQRPETAMTAARAEQFPQARPQTAGPVIGIGLLEFHVGKQAIPATPDSFDVTRVAAAAVSYTHLTLPTTPY